MILSLKWQGPQRQHPSQREERPQNKVCWAIIGRQHWIQSALTKRRVSIYILQKEGYDQNGHASGLLKIYCDYMQKNPSVTATHWQRLILRTIP